MSKIECLLFVTLILIFTYELCQAKIKHLNKYKTHFNLRNYHSRTKIEYLAPILERLQDECPRFSEKFDNAEVRYEECVGRTLSDESTLVCNKLETMILNCTQHVYSEIVDDCVGEKAKGVFSLVLQAFASVVDYLCKLTGEILLELDRSCLWNDLEEENESLTRCRKIIKEKTLWYTEHGFNTTGICRDLSNLKDCLKTRLTINCKCNKTQEFFLGLYDAGIAPCRSVLNN
ncbi:uncharacterized protein LOC135136699 [Zophobas morio]|uniref:uncharacterized protein LOC135136699 n=1 Tax=Zophobas morio TaxID=2755281 RepID=UPI0030833350